MTEKENRARTNPEVNRDVLGEKLRGDLFRAYALLAEDEITVSKIWDAFSYPDDYSNDQAVERARAVWHKGAVTIQSTEELAAWLNLVIRHDFQNFMKTSRAIETEYDQMPAAQLSEKVIQLVETNAERTDEIIELLLAMHKENAPHAVKTLEKQFKIDLGVLLGVNYNTFQLALLGDKFKDNTDIKTEFCIEYLTAAEYGIEVGFQKTLTYVKDAAIEADNLYLFRALSTFFSQGLDEKRYAKQLTQAVYIDTTTRTMYRLLKFASSGDGLKSRNAQSIFGLLPKVDPTKQPEVPLDTYIAIADGLTQSINDVLLQQGLEQAELLKPVKAANPVESLSFAIDRILYVIALDADPAAMNNQPGEVFGVVKNTLQEIAYKGILKNRVSGPRTLGDAVMRFSVFSEKQLGDLRKLLARNKSHIEIKDEQI